MEMSIDIRGLRPDLTKDPDALHDDAVTDYLLIAVRRNGAMSVEGCINNEPYALAMLDNARDTVKNHNARRRIGMGGQQLIRPGDTGLKVN
jgi:hypothetical protein